MAADYFLKLEGIKGESTDDKHKDEIDVLSFSWGASQITSWQKAGELSAGKVALTDFHFDMPVNGSSPQLFLACANGQHIKQAVFIGETASNERGGSQFLKYTLTDVLVSAYRDSGSQGGVVDQVALNFASIKTEATPGVRVDVAPSALGNLALDPKTGQVIVTESPSGLLTSGPSLGRDGGGGFDRGVVEYALLDLVGVINGPDPCTLMLDIREIRQPGETTGGEPPEDTAEGRRLPPGPIKKLHRHDVYWFGPTDLLLTPDDYSRDAHRLGSLQADPSGEPGEISLDLCEVVKKHGLESIGIRIQSAMDHTAGTAEDEGDAQPPEPANGPPFIIDPATFTLDLSLEMN